jgi:hypothetical protein
MIMSNTLFIDGKTKEVKFIEVNEEKKKISIYFKDFTFVALEDIKIINKGNDSTWN